MSDTAKDTRLLLVDDDDTFRRVLSKELGRRGFEVIPAATGEEALEKVTGARADVVLLDLHLPDIDGIEVLKRLREMDTTPGVVVLTGHGTIDTAIQAIRLGAHDYLEKPCPIEKVEMTVLKTHEHMKLVARQRILEDGFAARDVGVGMIGRSPVFRKLSKTIERIARADSATLILGETGVGKEMVATLVHAKSERRDAPFVVVDCASLHEDLLQSELFGHERGAFTGAMRQKHGLFEVAHKGALFLDEVGDTSPEMQAKLLRALETGRFRRLGGTKEIASDVRIISATNRNLKEAIARGNFRQDLFFRLGTLRIEIPPLRERRDDIDALVHHYVERYNLRFSVSKRFSPDAVKALRSYGWPGNVRELIHVVEQVMVLSDAPVLQLGDLPPYVRGSRAETRPEGSERGMTPLREVQRQHVLDVLDGVEGNRAEAARVLEISERHLYRLIRKYGWRDRADRETPSEP